MNDPNQFLKPDDIRALANSFQQSRILLTAIELDIFTVLDKHMLHSNEVAEKINCDARATDRIMNALVALGFLRKVKGKYYNSEHSSQFLVKGKPEFMGGLFHSIGLWDTWSFLTESVKTGTRGSERKKSSGEIDWLESFIGAMHYRGVKEAKLIALMLDLKNAKKILDVGGGSGAFAMEFVKNNPDMNAVIFDLPDVIPISKRYIGSENLLDKFSFIAGNYLENDFGTGYDMIFLSAIVHINSYEENKLLIKKCADALNPGGQIIIKDWIMKEERTEPAGGAFFALNMLVGTDRGDTYTETEMKEWFANAGVNKIEKKETTFGSGLLIGYKQ